MLILGYSHIKMPSSRDILGIRITVLVGQGRKQEEVGEGEVEIRVEVGVEVVVAGEVVASTLR